MADLHPEGIVVSSAVGDSVCSLLLPTAFVGSSMPPGVCLAAAAVARGDDDARARCDCSLRLAFEAFVDRTSAYGMADG